MITTYGFTPQGQRMSLRDTLRGRTLPLMVYGPAGGAAPGTLPVLFSPGYDKRPGEDAHAYTDYAYLGTELARNAMVMVAVQHDLPDDPRLPMVRPYRLSRLPDWERGVADLVWLRYMLSHVWRTLDWRRTVLGGHSNGGDMSALAATRFPKLFPLLFTLDNRRQPLPRDTKVLTLRGCDFPADQGVLPGNKEENTGITVVPLPGTGHSDMGRQGSGEQHRSIARQVCAWLRGIGR